MTLTLELTSEQEASLKLKADAVGVNPIEFLLRMIDEPQSVETIGDKLRRLGIMGGVEGKPREDGRAWSEIEGFE